MPIFEIEHGGRQFELDAPSMEAAMGALNQQPQPQQATARFANAADPAIDVAKSAGTGALKSAPGLVDFITQIGPEYGARGIDWATNKISNALGMGDVPRPGTKPPATDFPVLSPTQAGQYNPPTLQTADELYNKSFPLKAPATKVLGEAIGGYYKPQTPAGEKAETIGGFAGGLVGGPGGFLTRAATGVAAPYLASEAAEAATKGTGYETPAKIAAALLAPSAASKTLGARSAATTRTTAEELASGAGKTYETFKNAPVPGAPQAALTAEQNLMNAGRRPLNAPQAWRGIDELKALGPNATVADVRSVRQYLNNVVNDNTVAIPDAANKAERAVARSIIRQIDGTLESVAPELRVANQDYAAAMRAQNVRKLQESAEINSATAYSGRNVGNSIRQAFKPELKNPYGYTPEATRELSALVKGAGGVNATRYAANLLGGGGGLGQLATFMAGGGAGGFAVGGPGGALLGASIPVAGAGLKTLENALVRRQANRLEKAILAGAPSAAKSFSPQAREALARLLLSSAPARP